MLDPVKNAKIIGYVFFLFALINGISLLGNLNNTAGPAVLIMAVDFVVLIGVAYGLIKSKLWAIYGIGVVALLQLAGIFYNYSLEVSPSAGALISLALFVILFFWFFSAKGRFSK